MWLSRAASKSQAIFGILPGPQNEVSSRHLWGPGNEARGGWRRCNRYSLLSQTGVNLNWCVVHARNRRFFCFLDCAYLSAVYSLHTNDLSQRQNFSWIKRLPSSVASPLRDSNRFSSTSNLVYPISSGIGRLFLLLRRLYNLRNRPRWLAEKNRGDEGKVPLISRCLVLMTLEARSTSPRKRKHWRSFLSSSSQGYENRY